MAESAPGEKPQSIFRIHREERERFTILDNRSIRDGRLSFKATGILAYLLSLPDDWQVNAEHMSTVKTDGRDAVLSGFKELREAGYISKEYVREGGRIITTVWHVYEVAQPNPAFPTSAQPKRDFPTSENPAQRKNEEQEQPTLTNEFPLSPQGGECASSIKTKPDLSEGFEEFWKAYPKKEKKDKALSAWKRKRCAAIREEIMLALALHKTTTKWLKGKPPGQFIPYPATWINGGEWKNELPEQPSSNPQPTGKPKRAF